MLDLLTPELLEGTPEFIAACQTYEGGFCNASFPDWALGLGNSKGRLDYLHPPVADTYSYLSLKANPCSQTRVHRSERHMAAIPSAPPLAGFSYNLIFKLATPTSQDLTLTLLHCSGG